MQINMKNMYYQVLIVYDFASTKFISMLIFLGLITSYVLIMILITLWIIIGFVLYVLPYNFVDVSIMVSYGVIK